MNQQQRQQRNRAKRQRKKSRGKVNVPAAVTQTSIATDLYELELTRRDSKRKAKQKKLNDAHRKTMKEAGLDVDGLEKQLEAGRINTKLQEDKEETTVKGDLLNERGETIAEGIVVTDGEVLVGNSEE